MCPTGMLFAAVLQGLAAFLVCLSLWTAFQTTDPATAPPVTLEGSGHANVGPATQHAPRFDAPHRVRELPPPPAVLPQVNKRAKALFERRHANVHLIFAAAVPVGAPIPGTAPCSGRVPCKKSP